MKPELKKQLEAYELDFKESTEDGRRVSAPAARAHALILELAALATKDDAHAFELIERLEKFREDHLPAAVLEP